MLYFYISQILSDILNIYIKEVFKFIIIYIILNIEFKKKYIFILFNLHSK